MARDEAREWAYAEFGHAQLGDARRTARLVQMAAGVVRRPAGKVLDVFRSSAERQGAYDFLANEGVECAAMVEALRVATLERARDYRECIVSVDGSSLKLKDWKRTKDFGSIGARDKGARGLKVVHAYAIGSDGTPLGLVDQQWWARSEKTRRDDCHKRPLEEKETRHWVNAIDNAAAAFSETDTRAWFQLDREGDRYNTLKALACSGGLFTVRSTYDRRGRVGQRAVRLRSAANKGHLRGGYAVDVRRGSLQRYPRRAHLVVRTTTIALHLTDPPTGECFDLEVNVVDAREVGVVPRGAERVHWRLLTNHPIESNEEVAAVLYAYTQRWRIEDLHKTWKSGACQVERMQLRSTSHATRWAILLAANAARIERLKHLARNSPDRPANDEFTELEIQATRLMKRKYKKRTETIPDTMPSVGQMILWLAELGGYTGLKSSGGPPGSITIKRGLDFILPIAAALEQMRAERKKR
jgi:Transposase DNA-binding/Transposase DDE domain